MLKQYMRFDRRMVITIHNRKFFHYLKLRFHSCFEDWYQYNRVKDRKALATYVELKGYKNWENQWVCPNGTPKSSLDEIAKELNMSKRNPQRALRIERNLSDSMKELLDTGTNIIIFLE